MKKKHYFGRGAMFLLCLVFAVLFLLPTVVCALIWNYCKTHDRVILSIAQLVAALAVIRSDRKSVRVYALVLIFLTAWPLVCDSSLLTKLIRRISLFMIILGCWMLPTLHLFDTEKEKTE